MQSSPALSDTQPPRPAPSGPVEAEFERLYRDYHARIYNLTARIVGDVDEAADITQDVFLRAYSHPIDTSDGRSVEPWLYRIAVNASYDHLRRRAAHPATPLDSVPEVAAADDGFAGAETTRLVESCLAALTPRYRTALVLKDLHGLSNAEIADVMGLHHGATRVLLHRARASFKRAFRGAAPGKASGITTTLGLAAFLPELPVPASLQMPSWTQLAPAGPGLAPSLHPVAPPAGGEQVALSAGAPAAAVPAAAPVAQAGLLASLGGAAGIKTAVAVVAAVAVAGGGAAIGHYSEPADPGIPAASALTAASAGPGPVAAGGGWRHRELVQARLGLTGLAAAIGGPARTAGGLRAGGGSGEGQRLGGSATGGGGDATRAGGTNAGSGGSGSGGGSGSSGGSGSGGGSGSSGGSGSGGTDAGAGGGSGSGGTDAGAGGDTGGTGSGTGGTDTGGSDNGGTGGGDASGTGTGTGDTGAGGTGTGGG